MEGRIIELLSMLTTAEGGNIQRIISDLKTVLSSLEPSSILQLPDLSLLTPLFSLLSSNNPTDVEQACAVLERLLDLVSTVEIVQQFQQQLLLGLNSNYESVQLLCLSQLLRVAKNHKSVLLSAEQLLCAVINLIAVDHTGIALKAAAVFKSLSIETSSLAALLQEPFVSCLSTVQHHNDTSAFRLYQVICELSMNSEQHLALCQQLLRDVAGLLQSSDVLVQLNALELLSQLTTSNHCRRWLDESGVTSQVFEMLERREALGPMFSQLLGTGLLKYLGHVAHDSPEMTFTSGRLEGLLMSSLDDPDPQNSLLAAETVALIGSTTSGKHTLTHKDSLVSRTCNVLHTAMRSASRDLKLKSYAAFAQLIHVQDTSDPVSVEFSREAFTSLCSGPPLSFLRECLKAPDSQLHCAVLGIISAVADLSWAQHAFIQEVGFVEYLLDRGTETSKQGKEVKYSIIQRTLLNSQVKEVFGAEVYLQLKRYEKEGPYYVDAQVSVGLEGE